MSQDFPERTEENYEYTQDVIADMWLRFKTAPHEYVFQALLLPQPAN
jgi:hypothetical protein